MFWADKLLEGRKGPEWVNDSFTPSGIVHMGSLKGPVIHDVLTRILKSQGKKVKFTYGFDDFDPIDGLPADLMITHEKYMGVPISVAPSPDGNGTFGDFFRGKMLALLKELNVESDTYRTSVLYQEGTFDKAIKIVLDNAEKVRKVYSEMYKKEISSDWYPLQVICPKCGKLGTTKVTKWDGNEVAFACSETLVKWAKGCGTTGKISPFRGNAKMPWKVEWAAKWWTFGVTIEGAGKDHASAGGSYDVARKITKDVFDTEPPLRLPYEFFLYDGRKMSSSKGLGLTGEKLLEVVSPSVARFLMIKSDPNHAVEFNPNGTLIIPKLYDEYQKAAEEYKTHQGTEPARAFELASLTKETPRVRFQTLAQWVQMPNMENEIKKEGLEEWAVYAKVWVEKYAPESERFLVQKDVPKEIEQLSEKQKEYLQKLAKEDFSLDAEEIQTRIYEIAKEVGLSSKEAFAAIYISFLGKDHGPKAAWLLKSLDHKFVKERLSQASQIQFEKKENTIKKFADTSIFSINTTVFEKFPSVSVGIAIIKNVSIEKKNETLEKEKESLLSSLENLTTEQLGQYPEIISYRKLYKDMGVDWHSRRPSPEALLRRVALKKGLYTINTCVDAYNLVVMKHRISIGAFDLDNITFPTELRFAKNGEEILLLGDTEATKYNSTELAYFDQNGGYNIDFNFRDAKRTAVQLETKNIYINVDGVYDISPSKVEGVLKEACDRIMQYCGGTLETFGIVTS